MTAYHEVELAAIRAATDRPFNVNFSCDTPPSIDVARERAWAEKLAPYGRELGAITDGPPLVMRTPFSMEHAEAIAEFEAPVVSFHFGLPPAELVARVQKWGARVISSATTVEEALWLEAHGADIIVAQGLEAGGHRGHFLRDDLSRQPGTFAMVPQIVRAVRVPVSLRAGSRMRVAFVLRSRSVRSRYRSGPRTC